MLVSRFAAFFLDAIAVGLNAFDQLIHDALQRRPVGTIYSRCPIHVFHLISIKRM